MSQRLPTRIFWLLLVCCSIAWLSCGDDGGPAPDGGGTVDNTPPALAGVTPLDQYHVEVVFNEAVDKNTAERPDNYAIVEQSTAVSAESFDAYSPGDTVWVGTAVLDADQKTVALSTQQTMNNVPYNIYVSKVRDVSGNAMTSTSTQSFTGTNTPDVTDPEIAFRSPVPDATNVGIGQAVVVQFTEPMNYYSVESAFSWMRGTTPVLYDMDSYDATTFTFTSLQPLMLGTLYTVGFTAVAQDLAGNNLAATSWTFTTRTTADNTPPTLTASTPANGATNVSVTTNVSFTFSEPVDQNSLDDVFITPDPGDGVVSWSSGGSKVTFDPDNDLADNTQYTIVLPQGSVKDLAGNGLASTVNIQFTTGFALANGQISGVVSGDPASSQASNPAGTNVISASRNLLGDGDDFEIYGSDQVAANGTYNITHLEDGVHWPIGVMDSNGDGDLDPDNGDAIGGWGVVTLGDDADSVVIAGGSHAQNVDFRLFDQSVITGLVIYDGTDYQAMLDTYNYYVGLFKESTFDTTGGLPDPDFGTDPAPIVYSPEYRFLEFDGDFIRDRYYVGAFLDVNTNGNYDPDVDPGGFYEEGGVWAVVDADNGVDALNVIIHLDDPGPGGSFASSSWLDSGRKAVLPRPGAQMLLRRVERVLGTRR